MSEPVYLDCNATTPIDPRVRELVLHYLEQDFGNAGSRTHAYGARAKQAVQRARDQIASVIGAQRDEVLFTSGATEGANLALLGLAAHAERVGRKHIVTTAIEHKAVLEPLDWLAARWGFEIAHVKPCAGGWVDPQAVACAVRPDTLAVVVMHVNNETGIVQPILEIAELLQDHPAYLFVDAAQGFGKDLEPLRNRRIDFISVSGHKVFAPKGVGALVARRRGFERPPLEPLMHGGGQERGLRPGTLPVALVAGLGLAAELAQRESADRRRACESLRGQLLGALEELAPTIHGDQRRALPHVLNLSFPGIDSEALIVALKDLVAISNGSACTSQRYEPSHVLTAMGLDEGQVQGAIRLSWCHMTPLPDLDSLVETVRSLR